MKVQRKTILTLSIISIISFILLIVSYLLNFSFLKENMIELIKAIMSGIFTGAILTFITTLIMYYSEKSKYMEKIIKYSRIYYQTIQNSIQDCKNALNSYNISDINSEKFFRQNINVLSNRLNSANAYLASQNMVYKEEFQPIFNNCKKNKIIYQNIQILTEIYLNLSTMERDLLLEINIRENDNIRLFYYIKGFKEQLIKVKNSLNNALNNIDKNYSNSLKWSIITKEIDDFISAYNDLIIDKTINKKSEEIANKANMDGVMKNIKNFLNTDPKQIQTLEAFGNGIVHEIKKDLKNDKENDKRKAEN